MTDSLSFTPEFDVRHFELFIKLWFISDYCMYFLQQNKSVTCTYSKFLFQSWKVFGLFLWRLNKISWCVGVIWKWRKVFKIFVYKEGEAPLFHDGPLQEHIFFWRKIYLWLGNKYPVQNKWPWHSACSFSSIQHHKNDSLPLWAQVFQSESRQTDCRGLHQCHLQQISLLESKPWSGSFFAVLPWLGKIDSYGPMP